MRIISRNLKRVSIYLLILSFVFSACTVIPITAGAEEVLIPYGSYPQLDFEGTPPDHSTWAGDIDLRFVKDDPVLTAHTGTEAMYVNSDGGQFSVWGGPNSGEGNQPKAGDKVGGYFYYKRVSEKDGEDWKLPRVRIFSEAAGDNEAGWLAVTKDIETTNNRLAPVGEWVRVELESTGRLVSEEDVGHMGYSITCDGVGNEFMIDDVVFGAVTDSEDPDIPEAPSSSTSVIPVIDEYAGSTINGDFEVGNESTGNQYWGSYPDGILNFITEPYGTEPGSAKSGNNMIEVTDNGTSWNLFDFASDDDLLPRINDVVGGSYWLYVPEDADLSKEVPYVNFGYQDTSDVMISTGSGFDKSKLVKGAWNEIPILPMSGGKIENTDQMAAIFIIGYNIDTNVKYYIDNIKVGKLRSGITFCEDTSLVDAQGNKIELGENDTSVNAKLVVQNASYAQDTETCAIVAAYEDEELISVDMEDITIKGNGDTGFSVSESVFSDIDIGDADKSKLRIKAFLFDSISSIKPLALPYNLYYTTKKITPDNENICYIGRWAGDSDMYSSTYIRPYLKTNFTGSSIKIDLADTVSLVVTVDGETKAYNSVSGLVTLAENLLDGEHSLRVTTLSYAESIKYNGLYIDSEAELMYPDLKDTHIEFIGDSITAWDNGYSWQVGEKLGVEHTRIAWPGIALVDGFGYTGFNPLLGISSAYFKRGLPGAQDITADVEDWDFDNSQYTPDIIVINIGTNDCESIWSVPSLVNNFADTYSQFIDRLREQFPDAEIFVMRAVSMPRENINEAVYDMIMPKLQEDEKLHYIDTSEWGVTILEDNVHPDPNGHTIITDRLSEILSEYIEK